MDSGLGISGHSKSVLQMTSSELDYESPFIVENGVTKTHDKLGLSCAKLRSGSGLGFDQILAYFDGKWFKFANLANETNLDAFILVKKKFAQK